MTSTPLTSLSHGEAPRPLIPRAGWGWIAGLGLLFLAVHHVFLRRTVMFATTDNDWSHALVVPLIGVYYLFQRRDRLAELPVRVCPWGLPIMLLGLAGYAFWIYPGRNDMFQGYSMILALFGLLLFVLGPRMMTVLWFPVVYLAFAVKVSDRIWSQIAWQLQQIAARGATATLTVLGGLLDFDVANRGTTIDLTFLRNGVFVTEAMNVAEACSGLRMLMAFVALAVAMAFLWERAWWQRAVMILMAVPIALLVNIGRVTVLGLLFLVNPKLTRGDFHTFVGMLMLIPAGLLFLLLGWVLDRIIIEDEPSSGAGSSQAQGAAGAGEARPSAGGEPAAGGPWHPRAIGLGLAVGIVTGLVAGGAYAGMLSLKPPTVELPGVPTLLASMAVKMLWTLGPPALVGAAVGLALWSWRGRKRASASSGTSSGAGGGSLGFAAALAGGVLLATLIGHESVKAATEAVLIKKPVPLRHHVILLPADLGPWQRVHEDPPLPPEVLEVLGTRQYISRVYQDTSRPEGEPGSMVRLHVAYYTGKPDTVPHVPDRCFAAGGAQGIDTDLTTLELEPTGFRPDPEHPAWLLHPATLEPTVRLPERTFQATRFSYAPSEQSRRVEHVLYFFVANGRFLPTPDHVRAQGFDPQDQYSYYCKVEVQVFGVSDPQEADRRAQALLTHALPDIMACLPDWVDVTAGRWPPSGADVSGAGRSATE